MTPYTFFETLWQGKPEELYIQLWTRPNKRSAYFRQVAKAARIAEDRAPHNEVYAGVGLAPAELAPETRCHADQIAAIAGIWDDRDLASPHRDPRARLPATIEEANQILPAVFPPTIVVNSGYGLQDYWLFREVWVFGSPEEREQAHQLVVDWQSTIQFQSLRRNWTYDRLTDLARVLRVPGTFNHKDPEHPKPVEVIEFHPERRYNPSEIREYLDTIFKSEAAAAGRRVASAPSGTAAAPAMAEPAEPTPMDSPSLNETKEGQVPIEFIYDPRARVPKETLDLWLEEDPKFDRIWHYRPIATLKQRTPSNYDLALANWLRDIGSTQQQIVDAITHLRAFHHSKEHRNHKNYLTLTLDKCFNRRLSTDAPAATGAANAAAPAPAPTPAEKKTRKQKQEEALPPLHPEDPYGELACAWGFEIQRIVKIDGEHPTYRIETANRVLSIPGESTWLNQKAFTGIVLGQLNKVIPQTFSDKKWRRLVAIAMHAMTIIEADEENDLRGSALRSLWRYLSSTAFILGPEGLDEVSRYQPMVYHGAVAVSSGNYAEYLQTQHGEKATTQEAARRLKAAGGEKVRIQSRHHREQDRWLLPVAEFPPEEYASKRSIGSEITKEGEAHATETKRTNGSEH